MANITQGDGYYKTVVGWYGECSTTNGALNECNDLELKLYKQYISSAFQWDATGTLKPWKSSLPDVLNEKVFTKLECGNLYYLNIKPGTSSFTIPNFVISTYDAADSGRLTQACELPDPTPTPLTCKCYSDGDINVVIPNQDHSHMGHGFLGFPTGSEVSYDENKFETALSSYVELSFPNGSLAGIINFGGVQPKNNTIYVKYGNKCYSTTVMQSNALSNGHWKLAMSVAETLPPGCGDDIELPTPTPEPTPTPTPVDCSCAPDNYAVVKVTSSDMNHLGHAFKGFINDVEVSYDENTLTTAVSSQVSLNYPNSSFAGLIELGGKRPNNTTFYVKYGNKCFSATATSSNGSGGVWDLTMSVSQTLGGGCGDDKDFPTPTPAVDPTPTPAVHPTPTPVDCMCSPTNFTKIESVGPEFAGGSGHSFDGFADGVEVSYDESTLTKALSSQVSLNYSNSSFAGLINFGGKRPNNTTFYVKYGNKCFSATATSSNGSGGNVWDLTMSVSQTLSDDCGDDKDLPTPTPAPDPTPTPVPSEILALEFRWHEIGGKELLQVKNLIKPTDGSFESFDSSQWTTLYGFAAPPSAYDLDDEVWPDAAVHADYSHTSQVDMDGVTITLGSVESNGIGDYKQLIVSNATWSNDATPPSGALFVNVGNIGNEDSASSISGFWPVILKLPPIPVECCPSATHTSFKTHSGFDSYSHSYTPPGGNKMTLLTYKGLGSGGKLCVDLTLADGWQHSGFESTKKVYFNSSTGPQVGTIKKSLNNGSTRNDIYFIDSDGKCHHGVYGEAEEIVLAETGQVVVGCCDSDDEKLEIVNGNQAGTTKNQISVNASDNGEMDGNLCWPRLEGFAAPSTYQVKFEGLDQEVQQILITATTNVSSTKFRYEHNSGTCYEGFLLQNQISTFQEV